MKAPLRALLALISFSALPAMGGCSSTLTNTVTVSGTASAPYWSITGNATVAVTSESNSYSTQVTVSNVGSNTRGFSFGIAGVPTVNYSVTTAFKESTLIAPNTNVYTINGGGSLEAVDVCTGLSVSNIAANKDATIDLTMANEG
jgi:hypothetical protein